MKYPSSTTSELQDLIKGSEKYVVEGDEIEVMIMGVEAQGDPSFSPLAPYFVERDGRKRVYISEAFPAEFRYPAVVHEITEGKLLASHPNGMANSDAWKEAHIAAIEAEIEAARESGVLEDYLSFRIALYRQAIKYIQQQNPEAVAEERIYMNRYLEALEI